MDIFLPFKLCSCINVKDNHFNIYIIYKYILELPFICRSNFYLKVSFDDYFCIVYLDTII